MKKILLTLLFSLAALCTATAQEEQVLDVGMELKIEYTAPEGTELRLRALPDDQGIWINLWRKGESQTYGVLMRGLDSGHYDLSTFAIQYDVMAPDREIAFTCPFTVKGTLTKADDGEVRRSRTVWPEMPLQLGYRFYFALLLGAWCVILPLFMLYRLYRRIKNRPRKAIIDNEEIPTLLQRLNGLIDTVRAGGKLSPADGDYLYVLVLSLWAQVCHWGGKQRILNLYPKIYADSRRSALHRSLEDYLYANAAQPDWSALIASCTPEQKERL